MDENKIDPDQMWHDWFMVDAFKTEQKLFRFFQVLPHDPRCKLCFSPFEGIGGAPWSESLLVIA